MRLKLQVLLSLFVAALAGVALTAAAAWPIKTAFYPRVIGVPLLVLAAAEFILILRGAEDRAGSQAMDIELSDAPDPGLALRRTAGIFAWILGFFLGIVLLGFPLAIPLFVLAYLRGQGKESWPLSVALAGVAWLAFNALFVRLLHLPFPEGVLLRLMR